MTWASSGERQISPMRWTISWRRVAWVWMLAGWPGDDSDNEGWEYGKYSSLAGLKRRRAGVPAVESSGGSSSSNSSGGKVLPRGWGINCSGSSWADLN